MRSSRENYEKRNVFDVNASETGFVRKKNVLNLRPNFRKRRPLATAVIVIAVIGLSLWVMRQGYTRAETTDFFPAACLGNWQNTANAQGQPETLNAAAGAAGTASGTVLFNDGNSAILLPAAAAASQIFCGGFLPPDYATQGDINNVGLTLVWQVGDAPASSSFVVVETPSSTPSSSNAAAGTASTTGAGVSATTTITPSAATSTVPATTTVASSSTSLLRWFVPSAFAQDTQTDDSSSAAGAGAAASTSAPDSDSSVTIPLGPPLMAPLTVIPTSTATSSPAAISASPTDSSTVVAATSTPPGTSTVPILPPAPDDNFLAISYSTDGGQTWIELAKVDPNDWQNFTATLPIGNWNDLKNLQIKVQGIPTALAQIPKVYLDGMFVEVHYDIPPALPLLGAPSASSTQQNAQNPDAALPAASLPPVITVPQGSGPVPANPGGNFTANQNPTFDMNLSGLPAPTSTAPDQSLPPPQSSSPPPDATSSDAASISSSTSLLAPAGRLLSFFFKVSGLDHLIARAQSVPQSNSLPTSGNPVMSEIFGPDGTLTNLQPITLTTDNSLHVTLPTPGRSFTPGRYDLKIWLWRNGAVYYTESSFTWGVLAVNFNKSIYTVGDTAELEFGLLTSQGHTVCNGDISADIVAPSGREFVISTANKKIARNPTCAAQSVTNDPDYSGTVPVGEMGTYRVSVTAFDPITGEHIALTDSFQAETAPQFDVERVIATRIYPPATYTATLKIIPGADYSGTIVETVPNSFQVTPLQSATLSFGGGVGNSAGDQTITWQVDLKKGVETDLQYTFKAPDVSPALYKLGPLTIGSWQESRQWQIAGDAAGDIILLWEGTSSNIPAGWICLNCTATGSFYGVFPRASSTFGNASSGADTINLSAAFVSETAESVDSAGQYTSGSTFPASTHTHTWPGFTTSNGDIRPPFKNLYFISANGTSTAPSGSIAIFEVASSSLPAGWNFYSPLQGNYLRGGENTTSTGGSATTNFTVASTITSGAANNTLTQGATNGPSQGDVSAASHTHTIAAGTVVTTSTNAPPFIDVVFAQASGNQAIPRNLIAFFNNTSLPTNWNVISTSGSAFAGNLLQGSGAFGATGGTSTDSFANAVLTSSADSGTALTEHTRNGTITGAGFGHTHNVTYSIANASAWPAYRDVILGQFSPPPPTITVSKVVLNASSAIILTPNATTTIFMVASTTDSNGNSNLTSATATIYRSGVSGGASCTPDSRNCYQIPASGCSFLDSNASVKCSADIWFYADATDASSSYPSQNWQATITATDNFPTSGSSSTASGVEMNTLLAIGTSPSSINYGSLGLGGNTSSTNQTVTVSNAGNASTSLALSGTALANGSNAFPTSSQHYATSSFTYGGSEQALSDAVTTVPGFSALPPGVSNGSIGSWALTQSLPYILIQHSVAAYNGYLYVVGGFSSITETSTVLYSSINTNGALGAWTSTQALPNISEPENSIAYKGYLYLLGGDAAGVRTSTVLYAPINTTGSLGSWASTQSMPYPAFQGSSVIYNNYIYMIGGADSSGFTSSSVMFAPINATGSLGAWVLTQALPHSLDKLSSITYNGYLYAIGGECNNNCGTSTSTVFYAPINATGSLGAWTSTQGLPSSISQPVTVYNGNYVYTLTQASSTIFITSFNSDGTLNAWTSTQAMPWIATEYGGLTYNNFLYILGGQDNSPKQTSSVFYAAFNNMTANTFWGAGAPASGYPSGNYTGTITFTGVFSQ